MDFIEGLLKSRGNDVIFVVVDRLSKYAHFMAMAHPFTALNIAQKFMYIVYKLHGMPQSIVSDEDKVFSSSFCQGFFRLMGTSDLSKIVYSLSPSVRRLNRSCKQVCRILS